MILVLIILLCIIVLSFSSNEIEIDSSSSIIDISIKSNIDLYSDAYIKDVYRSGVRRASREAKSDECRQLIEYEHMENMKTVLNVDQPWLFEDKLFFSQCAETVAKHPPMVRSIIILLSIILLI